MRWRKKTWAKEKTLEGIFEGRRNSRCFHLFKCRKLSIKMIRYSVLLKEPSTNHCSMLIAHFDQNVLIFLDII